jgi:curved DNA-binding protein CbpA
MPLSDGWIARVAGIQSKKRLDGGKLNRNRTMRRRHRDPYVVLGVGRQASTSEVARAYRRAARATHPDSRAGGGGSGEPFQAVSDAYETLRDPQRRVAYDRAHPPLPAGDGAAPPGKRSVRYAAPGRQHIVLGAASHASPDVHAARVEVVAPAAAPTPYRRSDVAALAALMLSLLRSAR